MRSLAWLLTLYPGVRQVFVAPESLQIGEDVRESLAAAGVDFTLTSDFEAVVPEVDAIYMTRIQDEWDTARESRQLDTRPFEFHERHLAALRPDAILMHPLPRREEIAVGVDRDPRAMYWRQVRNGMWMRVALVLSIFEKDAEVDRYYAELVR